MPVIRFGDFELDPDGAELRKGGIPLKLPPQPFEILVLLAGRPGQLVTREQIQQEVWGHNSFNLDQGINSSISQIRSVLGDVAEAIEHLQAVVADPPPTLDRDVYLYQAYEGLMLA